ncbi:hypothetical protein AAL_02807 [Moelleriella libera RCEF 2490]|uniref:Concanavalin A-like lectin/glucanase n=1 Tax=Moelleriella libera RCEF 2490 TaxID=1081109 RepID=A0A168E0E3_9HYPO|nr:hypothetical protein AAL_02807 [Moelleriella libera RCEF 2490]
MLLASPFSLPLPFLLLRLLVVLQSCFLRTCRAANTPVQPGPWKPISPSFSAQTCAGGSITNNNIFHLPASPNGDTSGPGCANGHLRAERRYHDDYPSSGTGTGKHQFAGSFTITSFSGDRIAIKQTFHGSQGPFFLLAVRRDGTLYSVEGGAVIAPAGVAGVGRRVTVNTVHDLAARRYSVYVNGQERFRQDDAPAGGSFYDKIGSYVTSSGTGGMTIRWDDVAFWTQ